nr:LysM peptidoglycan-binding domain-containing protein [Maliibacterium massiliense]
MVIHIVQQGQTLYSIARQYGVRVEDLIAANGITFPSRLVVGQTLVIRFPQDVYQVTRRQTLAGIARARGMEVRALARNNPGMAPEALLEPGTRVILSYQQPPVGSTQILGYAYPNVDQALLRATTPYLTYLVPFTHEIGPDDALQAPSDAPLLQIARQGQVSPLMGLSNLREPQGFLGEVAHRVLSEVTSAGAVIAQAEEIVLAKGYCGVDVDFEYVFAEDRLALAAFLRQLAMRMHALDREVFAALAPRVSATQQSTLVSGHDYEAVGGAVDAVLLMTYEWGYAAGPPMAVAPYDKVREVLDFAVTQMPAGKILLGVPNYGYDWPLPYVPGQSRARSLSNVAALALAMEQGAEIQFDTVARAPYFRYRQDGVMHEVWFEDARSIQAKLELILRYGLKGAGYWNLMYPFQQNWSVLAAMFDVDAGRDCAQA